MNERLYTVRLKMRDGLRQWTEEHEEYTETAEDAVACAAAAAHPQYAVRGATVTPTETAKP